MPCDSVHAVHSHSHDTAGSLRASLLLPLDPNECLFPRHAKSVYIRLLDAPPHRPSWYTGGGTLTPPPAFCAIIGPEMTIPFGPFLLALRFVEPPFDPLPPPPVEKGRNDRRFGFSGGGAASNRSYACECATPPLVVAVAVVFFDID